MTPENEAVVWLPNAVLLAALLHYQGQRGWLLAALTFTSDFIGNLHTFAWDEDMLMCLTNLTEVTLTYLMMRQLKVSPSLDLIQDFGKFIIIGPMLGAMLGGFLGAAIIKSFDSTAPNYLTLMRLWWFGDGLGLLIYTPLLLVFTQKSNEIIKLRWHDLAVGLISVALAVVIFFPHGNEINGILVTSPTLLLPSMLYLAARFDTRWTALAVALVSLTTAKVLVFGHHLFGNQSLHLEVLRAQEFILILCIVGMGASILLSQIRKNERELEHIVEERTAQLRLANEELLLQATTDALTGLCNRRAFFAIAEQTYQLSLRTKQKFTIIMMDVDHFKLINDRFGHPASDKVLTHIGQCLSTSVRSSDTAARYGGEEFVVLAPETGAEDGMLLAERIHATLRAAGQVNIGSQHIPVTASFGLAELGENETLEQLLSRADEALYQAKNTGRDRIVQANSR